MKLSAEQVYDELNGEEVKAVLLERVRVMLDSVPDFQRHLTVPRVRMLLNVRLQIYGRRVPLPDLETDLTVTTRQPVEDLELARDLEAEDQVNADTGAPVPGTPFDGTGDPPDQVREENGLPVMDIVKTKVGTFQRPAPPPAAPPPPAPTSVNGVPLPTSGPGGVPYAANRVLMRGGPVVRGFVDYLPEASPVVINQREDKRPEVPIQNDFRDTHRPEK